MVATCPRCDGLLFRTLDGELACGPGGCGYEDYGPLTEASVWTPERDVGLHIAGKGGLHNYVYREILRNPTEEIELIIEYLIDPEQRYGLAHAQEIVGWPLHRWAPDNSKAEAAIKARFLDDTGLNLQSLADCVVDQ